MLFNETSWTSYAAKHSVRDFVGITLNTKLDARPPWSSGEHVTSLGDALASIPNDSGCPVALDFRVFVNGKERELSTGVREEVYRICREAIVNACRHSRATVIETEIEYRATELRVAVRDNGCGIDSREMRWGRDGHWGLQAMRELAERIGARLRLLSKVALGTEVELCVPGRVAFEQSGVGFARCIGVR